MRLLFALFLVLGGVTGPLGGVRYVDAPFDDAADFSGSGPAASGAWDPAGVVTGTGSVINHDPAVISAFVDPASGLEGSAKGFRFQDVSDRTLLLDLFADPAVAAPTSSAPYWVRFVFRLDPDASLPGDALVHTTIFDSSGGPELVNVSLGRTAAGELRYKIYNQVTVLGDLGPLTASDVWTAVIKVDPQPPGHHTHWIRKNGDMVTDPILGIPHDLANAQTAPFDRLTFQTSWGLSVGFEVDQVTVADSGPPVRPEGLLAAPAGDGGVQLTWTDRADDENGFIVQRSDDGISGWTQVATAAADAEMASEEGLPAGETFHYRVAAYNDDGVSPYTDPVRVMTVYRGRPLSDWLNVLEKGASPDDGADDTDAIQAALDELQGDWGAPTPQVLYFPNGEYLISDTSPFDGIGLRFERTDAGTPAQHNGIQLVGESAGGVVLRWHDAEAGMATAPKVLFHDNGNPRCVFRNLVWDGGDADGQPPNFVVAFDQSSRNEPGWHDSATAHYDSTFRNAYIGLRIGHFNKQNSEITIRRGRFLNNGAGVSVEDFNALNIWFWDSEFADNEVGVSNAWASGGAGDFRVIRGRFKRSAVADIHLGNTGDFTIRDSWSTGSARFLHTGLSTATSRTSLIGNRISGTTAPDGRAILLSNAGPFLLLNNSISSAMPTDSPVFVSAPSGVGFPDEYRVNVVAVHNDYTVDQPYGQNRTDCCKIVNVDDRLVPSFSVSMPPLPVPVDPVGVRPVYTLTSGEAFQAVVDQALADDEPALVHLPNGTYPIEQTVTVPEGADLMILGNGQTTRVLWTGEPGGTMFEIDGHQARGVTMRDLNLWGSGAATGIRVFDLNQEGARALLNKVGVSSPSNDAGRAGVVINGCDRVEVAVMDSGVDGTLLAPGSVCSGESNVGHRLVGGPQPAAGIFYWTGASAGNGTDFEVINGEGGVRALISSVYMEQSSRYARVSGSGGGGEVTVHGGKMALVCSPDTAAVAVEDFTGNVSVVNNGIFDLEPDGARVEQSGGDVGLQVVANAVYSDPEYVHDSAATFSRVAEVAICQPLNTAEVSPLCPEAVIGGVPLPDIDVDPTRLTAAVRLLWEYKPPGFYDEFGASATHQVNVDNVRIDDPVDGLVLEGGIPQAPATLTATAVSGSRVELAWTSGSRDEDLFRVERSLDPATGYLPIGSVPGGVTAYADEDVVSGTTYHYRVVAHRQRTGDSGASNVASASPAAPGGVPDGAGVSGTPLMIDPDATVPGDLALRWSPSCGPDTQDYAVYEGLLGDWTSHVPARCTTDGLTTIRIEPASGSRYYLVVPRAGTIEGSYGEATPGLPRPRSATPCAPGFDASPCH